MKVLVRKQVALVAATLLFGYGNFAQAQERVDSKIENEISTVQPVGLESLKGIDMSSSGIREHLSTGRPAGDRTKQIVIYNVGARKFLNVGNYWGTHASLSDVPHVFWLQRHSDDTYSHLEYVRYPDTDNGQTTTTAKQKCVLTSLLNLSEIEVGAQQGEDHSHSTYKTAKIINTDGTETPLTFKDVTTNETVTLPYSPNGNTFTTGSIPVNFYTQKLKVEMDMTTCTRSDKFENLISVGEDIASWNSNSTTKLHVYAKKSGSSWLVRVQYVDRGSYKESVSVYDLTTNPSVTLTLSVDGLYINDKCVFYTGKTVGAQLAYKSSLSVANTYGDNKTNATCGDIQLVAPEPVKPVDMLGGDIKLVGETEATTKATDGKYAPDGKKFYTETDIDFNRQKLVVDIDMSTAQHESDKNENTLSIGSDVTDWNKDKLDFHMYFNGWPKLNAEGKYDENAEDQKDKGYRFHLDFLGNGEYKDYTDQATKDIGLSNEIYIPTEKLTTITTKEGEKKVVRVELSKNGLYIGGEKIYDATCKQYIEALLALTHIQVGSAEGNVRSHATYYNIKTENLDKDLEDKTLAKTTTEDCFTTEKFELGNYTLKTNIDVSACKTDGETALSIGLAPDEWNTSVAGHENLHLQYHSKTQDGKYVLKVSYVSPDYSEESDTRYIASEDGMFSVTYSKSGLTVNDTQVFLSDDVTLTDAVPYVKDKENDIVPFLMDDCNHPLIGTDGKFQIDEAEGRGLQIMQNTYLYTEDHTDSMPVFLTVLNKKASSGKREGSFMAYTFAAATAFGDMGVFVDRALPEEIDDPELSRSLAQWTFTTAGPRNGGDKVYTMSLTTQKEIKMQKRTEEGKSEEYTVPAGTTLYLAANNQYVYSSGLGCYYDDKDGAHVLDMDGAELQNLGDGAMNNQDAQWKVFTLEDYYKLFKDHVSEMTNMLNMSFVLKDPDFKREDGNLSYWKIDPTLADGKTHIGYDEYYKTATDQAAYTGTASFATLAKNMARNHGRYLGVEIKSNGARGKFYQDVDVHYAGWYAITCQGMSNAGAKLFVQMIGNDGTESLPMTAPLTYVTKAERERLSATEYTDDGLQGWPYSYLQSNDTNQKEGMPFYNALVDMNDKNLNDGKNVEKYNAQLSVFIDPDVVTGGKAQKLRFGVMLDDEKTQNTNNAQLAVAKEAATETVTADEEWTVFDNFQLLFGGNSEEPYLVIDEDNTSLDNITSTIHHYSLRPMALHRTFKKGADDKPNWATIILPVSLTKSQFYKTFGEGSELAELEKLTDTTIDFKSVTATADDDVMLKENTPYIIKPVNIDGGDTEEYVARLYTRNSNGKDFIEVTSPARHFFIEGVTLSCRKTDLTGQYCYDFPSDYTFAGQVARNNDGSASLQAYGTICQNYALDSKTGKNALIDGRPTLQNCYLMSGNNLLYRTKPYGTKGLRCWFGQETSSGTQISSLLVTINGVADGTTSIEDICGEEIAPVGGRYASGIYNLSGQKVSDGNTTDSLCPGMYIVNGKKVLVVKK